MFYVVCDCCSNRVEVPADAVGPDRTDLWNVIECDVCDATFDYDDEDVFTDDDTKTA